MRVFGHLQWRLFRNTARDNAWHLGWSLESFVIIMSRLMILTGGLEDWDRLTSFNFFSATTCMEYGHKFDFFSLYARLPVKIPQADE